MQFLGIKYQIPTNISRQYLAVLKINVKALYNTCKLVYIIILILIQAFPFDCSMFLRNVGITLFTPEYLPINGYSSIFTGFSWRQHPTDLHIKYWICLSYETIEAKKRVKFDYRIIKIVYLTNRNISYIFLKNCCI